MGTPPELIAELEAQARAAEADPGFPRPLVERVRSATRWLGVGGSDGADVRHAAMRLRRQAGIDLEPPVDAGDWRRRAAKRLVRRLVGWYVRFLGAQVAALGQASAALGSAVAERTERIEADTEALSAQIEALAERVARLEAPGR